MKKIKLTPIVLAAGMISSAVVRFIVITGHTEISNNPLKRSTGFLYHGDELLWNGLYYGLILAAAVAAIFTSIADGKKDSEALSASAMGKGKVIAIGLLTMAAAVFAACEGVAEMRAFTPTTFLIISDFLFTVIMADIAIVTLNRKSFTPVVGALYSLIGVYCICRGIYCFMSRMAISTVPDYMIQSLSLIGMAIYFVMLARFLSGNPTKHTKKALSFWGVGTASLIFSSAAGAFIAKLVAPADIKACIVYTSAAAENYRQARAGADAYNLVITPLTEIVLGLVVVVTLIIAFSKPRETE